MELARMWDRDGSTIIRFKDLLRPFPPHFHNKMLVGCLTSGKRRLQLPGLAVILSAGDTVILPPFLPHSCNAVGNNPVDWICTQLPMAEFSAERRLWQPAVVASPSPFPGLLMELWHGKKRAYMHLLAQVRPLFHSHPFESRLEEWDNLRHWLNGTLAHKISIGQMASRAGMGKYAMLRKFHTDMGITPYSYLESLRIIKAEELLDGKLALAECALATGFYDQAHFTRTFKNQVGLSPGSWRNRKVKAIEE